MQQVEHKARLRAVGLYLAAVQLCFALGWVIYAIYLPELAQRVGLERHWVPWILALDQLVFICTDLAVGVWSDRAAAIQGRIARWVLGATLLSTAAFLLLPWAASGASPGLFLGLTVLWAATSAALRAPPLTLLGRYVPRPMQPTLIALSMLGLGLASAAAPYLGLQLKAIDPRWPFALSALVLAAVTLGMVAAERSLARPAGAARPDPVRPGVTAPAAAATAGAARMPQAGAVFLVVCALAALSFQVHVFLSSTPLYLRHATRAELPALLPVFWIGFNLALWPASVLARRIGAPRALAMGAVAAAFGVSAAHLAPSLQLLIASQALAGAAWALVLCSAFASALSFGHSGREGLFSGSLQSILALGALSRLMVLLLLAPSAAQQLAWAGAPALVFALAALLLVAALSRAKGWPAPTPAS